MNKSRLSEISTHFLQVNPQMFLTNIWLKKKKKDEDKKERNQHSGG